LVEAVQSILSVPLLLPARSCSIQQLFEDTLALFPALLDSTYLTIVGFDLLDPETVGLASLHHQEAEEEDHPAVIPPDLALALHS
jgi:hypothetical protein